MSLRFFCFKPIKCIPKTHKSQQQCASQDTVELVNATKTANTSNIQHNSISQTGRTAKFLFIISY